MNKRYDLVRLICWFGLGAIMLAAAACSGVGYAAQNDEVQTSPDGKGYASKRTAGYTCILKANPMSGASNTATWSATNLGRSCALN